MAAGRSPSMTARSSPGGLRDLLGLEIHGFLPLRAGQATNLSNGNAGTVWAEDIHPATATVVASYLDGPAITRNAFGGGTAWYVSTKLDGGDLTAVVLDAVRTAGPDAATKLPQGLEVITRSNSTDTHEQHHRSA